MQTRRDGSAAYDKSERSALTKGAPLEGSSGRTRSDPRWRRGPQSEQEVHQRFHPDDFEVDSEQRWRLKRTSVSAQAVCVKGDSHALALASTWYTLGLNAPATSIGDFITGDPVGDHISLRGGHVYMATASVRFKNELTSAGSAGYLLIREVGGPDPGTNRQVSICAEENGRDHRGSILYTAVVDLSARGAADIEIRVLGGDAEVSVDDGWITVQRIG